MYLKRCFWYKRVQRRALLEKTFILINIKISFFYKSIYCFLAIIFVYDYYPGLETLQYRLYNNPNINLKGWANPYNLDGAARPFSAGKTINGSRSLGLLPEQNVWEYVVQLASMIRSVHSANLAVRIVMPSRILVDHKSRLRLSGVGIFDVLDQENNPASIAQHQVRHIFSCLPP